MVTRNTYKARRPPKGFVCPDGASISKEEWLARRAAWEEEQVEVAEFKKTRKKAKAEKKSKK